jgi:hypothetical protein
MVTITCSSRFAPKQANNLYAAEKANYLNFPNNPLRLVSSWFLLRLSRSLFFNLFSELVFSLVHHTYSTNYDLCII